MFILGHTSGIYLMLQEPYVPMTFYSFPLQAKLVYQESVNHLHNRTTMHDSWPWSGFSFYHLTTTNPQVYDDQYLLCGVM